MVFLSIVMAKIGHLQIARGKSQKTNMGRMTEDKKVVYSVQK
jgi:hypothetical protein